MNALPVGSVSEQMAKLQAEVADLRNQVRELAAKVQRVTEESPNNQKQQLFDYKTLLQHSFYVLTMSDADCIAREGNLSEEPTERGQFMSAAYGQIVQLRRTHSAVVSALKKMEDGRQSWEGGHPPSEVQQRAQQHVADLEQSLAGFKSEEDECKTFLDKAKLQAETIKEKILTSFEKLDPPLQKTLNDKAKTFDMFVDSFSKLRLKRKLDIVEGLLIGAINP